MTNSELKNNWLKVLTVCNPNKMDKVKLEQWYRPLNPVRIDESAGIIYFTCKDQNYQLFKSMINQNYSVVRDAVTEVFGKPMKLELIEEESSSEGYESDEIPQFIDEHYTFESFVSGSNNRLALACSLAIAERFTPDYNPLFIYGGSGVGKTHLANAIGNQVKRLDPQARVLYVSANTFKLQFQDARNANRIPDFLNFYQSVDVLIVDDIQYFAGLKGTQDTFFHIFNYLQQSRKQLILTSDRAPIELKDIEERLLTRFKWGLSAEISRPDYQLRRSILLSKMHQSGISLSDDVVDFIAQNVRDSVRDLEGTLASLLAHSTLTDKEIDLALAEQVVSHIVAIQPHPVTVADVLGTVAEHYNIPEKAITSQNRSKEISLARHVAVYLCKQLTKSSLAEIGFKMGKRTHATMLHSIAYVRDQLEFDPVMRQHIAQLESALTK